MSRVLLAGFGGLGAGQDHQRAMYLPAFQAHPGFTVAGVAGERAWRPRSGFRTTRAWPRRSPRVTPRS